MKIAWFGHVASARRNGKVAYSRMMLHALREHAIQVVFFFNATREANLVIPPSSRAVQMCALDLWNRASISAPTARHIIESVLRQERPDIAHVSLSFSNLDSPIAKLCHDSGIPVVGTWHMPFGPKTTFWGKLMDLAIASLFEPLTIMRR